MSKQTAFDKVRLAGVDIDALTLAEATDYIVTHCQDPAAPAGYIVKPYVEFLDRASHDPAIAELLNGAELSIADGVAVLWAAHYLYAGPHTPIRFVATLGQILFAPAKLAWPVPERAAGTNFTWQLLHAAAQHNLKVYLVGKPSDIEIEAVASRIRHEVPHIQIVGTHAGHDQQSHPGSIRDAWTQQLAAQISEAKPDLILVGMGFPLQERVCRELANQLPHGIFVGEGGTFDYDSFGGTRRKAPVQIQRLGLEWLWRLALEPSRVRRQLAIPRFMYTIWQSRH